MMKKVLLITAAIVFVVMGSVGNVWACWNCTTNNYTYEGDTHNEGGTGIGVGIGIGKGGNATIEEGAIKVKNKNTNVNSNFNSNFNSNKNTNINTNKNTNMQGQDQKQIQGQGQDQKQKLEFYQVYEDVRDHIVGPAILAPDPKFRDGEAGTAKTLGFGLLDALKRISWDQAKKLGSNATDFKVETALLFENKFRTDGLEQGASGVLMGYIYVIPEGPDVSGAGAIGRATAKGMLVGATHFVKIATSAMEATEGSAWNIGLGGGASILADGDSKAIAPNAGTGYGKAKTHNELRPELVIAVYYDKAYVKNAPVDDDDLQDYGK